VLLRPGTEFFNGSTLCRSWERPLAGWWVSDDAEDSMSAEDLRKAMLDLMAALSDDIIRTEAIADELTQAAMALSDHQRGAKAIRDTAVHKRVEAIELRGKLAALHESYAARFNSEGSGARRR
jgi:hypothetical protein